MAMATMRPAPTETASGKRTPRQLPAPNSDFYQLSEFLTANELALVKKVRTYMESAVQPKGWVRQRESCFYRRMPAKPRF